MALEDSNPTRRNLTIYSLSIIIFYIGGGYFPNKEIHLPLVNIVFTKTDRLVFVVWFFLIYFTYIYWLNNCHSWKEKFCFEFNSATNESAFLRRYLISKYNKELKGPHYLDSKIVNNHKLKEIGICFKWWINEGNGGNPNLISLSGLKDKLILTKYIAIVLLVEPTLLTYFTPYLLAYFAIWLGIYHDLSHFILNF